MLVCEERIEARVEDLDAADIAAVLEAFDDDAMDGALGDIGEHVSGAVAS